METHEDDPDRNQEGQENVGTLGTPANPGGGIAMALVVNGENSYTPEQQSTPDNSQPASHQGEDASDSDMQDEESGEEYIQQPHHSNTQSPLDAATMQSSHQPTSISTHLNNFISSHPLLKMPKMEADADILNSKSGLEALQAAINSGGFNLPFGFAPHAAFLTHSQHSQNNHSQTGMMTNIAGTQIMSPNNTRHSDSPHGSSINGGEIRESSSNSVQNVRAESNNTAQNNNVAGPSHQQQQTSWSFEEQFKQLYDISDDPKRKEFLDSLFSFMQQRGQPINRLPIMAKAVLDLYELYNLVVARGGLVDVINKKLWQEIIKGLHLPSSITSAAFTLRTQYMKYLYDYECFKEKLSTRTELQAAIDGNRREGRRSSYGSYTGNGSAGDSMVQRNQHTPNSLAMQMPLPIVGGGQHHMPQSLNGSAAHTPLPHHPHHPQHPQGILGQAPHPGPAPGMAPPAELVEYFKQLNKELNKELTNVCVPPAMLTRQGNGSSRPSTPSREGFMDMIRINSWYNTTSLYPSISQQLPHSPQRSHSPLQTSNSPEPQREALDLGLRTSPLCSSPAIQSPPPPSNSGIQLKRERLLSGTPRPINKRILSSDDDSQSPIKNKRIPSLLGEASPAQQITISTRVGGENGAVEVSIVLNGTTYEGVLFAQDHVSNTTTAANATSSNNTKTSRSTVS